MRLTGDAGDTFELSVIGYEFPRMTEEGGYDANWLNVRVNVTAQHRSWTATDPCLLTNEVAELADWLETIVSSTKEDK